MKLSIESTDRVVIVDGIPTRLWEGQNEAGVKVECLIVRIAAHKTEDLAEFEHDLVEHRAPTFSRSAYGGAARLHI